MPLSDGGAPCETGGASTAAVELGAEGAASSVDVSTAGGVGAATMGGGGGATTDGGAATMGGGGAATDGGAATMGGGGATTGGGAATMGGGGAIGGGATGGGAPPSGSLRSSSARAIIVSALGSDVLISAAVAQGVAASDGARFSVVPGGAMANGSEPLAATIEGSTMRV